MIVLVHLNFAEFRHVPFCSLTKKKHRVSSAVHRDVSRCCG
nr:MAG TPA: hypothetical protein [Caudoviricetes sp.]